MGHRSLKALRMYENPTAEQHVAACNVLVKKSNVPPPEVPTKPSITNQGNTSTGLSPLFGSVQHCSINVQVYNHWACIYAECGH